MLDATAQDRDADANSLASRNSFAESRFGVEWRNSGDGGILSLSRSFLMKSISRTSIRIADVNYYARRSANCLIACLTVTQFLRDVIFILKVRSINLRQGLKNKFTIPLDINCLDLLGRIASSCSCASHRKLLLGGKTSAISSSTLSSADDVMKVKYRENSIFISKQILAMCKRLT